MVKDVPRAELHLVGDEPMTEPVATRARELGVATAVQLHGRLDRPAVAALLRDVADVLVVASRSETFGVVIIEAMACGKPVVATRCGGPENLVTDPRLGELCPNHDPAALAQSMMAVAARLTAQELPYRRHTAESKYSIASLAEELASQYQAVARCRTPSR